MDIKKNIQDIKDEIKKYSPHPDKVKLIVVTKYGGVEDIEKVLAANYNVIAENKAQVFRDKLKYFKEKKIENIEWHFIGNLQSNKIKYIIEDVKLIHSVNKLSLAKEIDKQAKAVSKKVNILLEVNIFGEESKHGYEEAALIQDLAEYKKLENINICGLMTMAPYTDDEDIQRQVFSSLRALKDRLNKEYFSGNLTELSMGMTNDYKVALEEGATLIRIGRKIFE